MVTKVGQSMTRGKKRPRERVKSGGETLTRRLTNYFFTVKSEEGIKGFTKSTQKKRRRKEGGGKREVNVRSTGSEP